MTNSSRPDARRNASPYLYGEEAEAVARVPESGQYGHGAVTEEFERRVADFLGIPDAVAVASGTAALHLALIVAGVGPGDEVIVPSMTFCATVQAILAVGATPRFVDIELGTLCVNDQLVMEAVSDATAAVIPVLFGGRAVGLAAVQGELDERGIAVIEDAAHAFGSRNGPRRVGAGRALTCFSFGPIKNLTCGQGGMVIPRTPEEADTVRRSGSLASSSPRRSVRTQPPTVWSPLAFGTSSPTSTRLSVWPSSPASAPLSVPAGACGAPTGRRSPHWRA